MNLNREVYAKSTLEWRSIMRILLTGATGFVGSELGKSLLGKGHSLCIVKRSFSNIRAIEEWMDQCSVYNLDQTNLREIYQKEKIDCVIHCATYYGRSDNEYTENIKSNLLFPLELLCLSKDFGIKYFLNTDSFFEDQITTEQDLDKEIYMCGYTLSKVQFREWGRMFAAKYGIGFVNMKLEHVYGEMEQGDKFIPYLVKELKKNILSIALSDGAQKRDFVHISDVVNAYIAVLSNLEKEGCSRYVQYEVGTGTMRSLREFAEIIKKAVCSTTKLEWGAIPRKEGELMQSKADNSALINMGWKPFITKDSDIEQKFGGGVQSLLYNRFKASKKQTFSIIFWLLHGKAVCLNG